MLFEITKKAEAISEAFVFQTIFRHRGGNSATTKKISTLFLFHHSNKIDMIVFLYRGIE